MSLILGILTTTLLLYYLSLLNYTNFKDFIHYIYLSNRFMSIYNITATIITIGVFSYCYYCLFRILEIINN